MRANPVAALLVRVQRATRISRTVVQIPVHFFVFQAAMNPLRQAQLGGGLDADMIEMLARIVVELSVHETAAVVGDQRRRCSALVPFFLPMTFSPLVDIGNSLRFIEKSVKRCTRWSGYSNEAPYVCQREN